VVRDHAPSPSSFSCKISFADMTLLFSQAIDRSCVFSPSGATHFAKPKSDRANPATRAALYLVRSSSGTFDERSSLVPSTASEQRRSCGVLMSAPPTDGEPPEDFKCPITLRLMRDPVLLHTPAGRSYERAALEEHLRLQPHQDPLTRKRHREALSFTPNRTLKNVIEAWQSSSPQPRSAAACAPSSTIMQQPRTVEDAVELLVASGDVEASLVGACALATFCATTTKSCCTRREEVACRARLSTHSPRCYGRIEKQMLPQQRSAR